MKYGLLEWLVCPRCRSSHLKLTCFRNDAQQSPVEVLEGLLACARCGQLYPVVAGIPRMLPDSFHQYYEHLSAYANGRLPKASISEEEMAAFRDLHQSTEEGFSFEWLRYRVTGMEENTGFLRRVMTFRPEELAGKLTLDAGCGMGRFLEVVAGWGAEVVGLDLSLSVERAWRETRHRARVHFIQGDILRPPLKPQIFDFIYSVGVLHHTPDTRLAFHSLCPLLRPEGKITVWVYRTFQPEIQVGFHKRVFASLCQLASDGARLLTKKMPHRLLHYLCYAAVPLGWLKRKVCENRILKHIFWPLLLLPISAHEKWQVRLCDTFDWLAPQYQWKHTTREVQEWFQEAGLADAGPGERAVSVTGVMPLGHDASGETTVRAPQSGVYVI